MELKRAAVECWETHRSPTSVELASQGQQKPCKKVLIATQTGAIKHALENSNTVRWYRAYQFDNCYVEIKSKTL